MRSRTGVVAVAVAIALVGIVASVAGGSSNMSRVTLALLRNRALHPAENVRVTVRNESVKPIDRSDCFMLARVDANRWHEVRFSHGVNVACAVWAGEVQPGLSRRPLSLALYDDLRPGTYRITLFYRPISSRSRVLRALTRRDRSTSLQFTLTAAPYKPRPHLSEKRIIRLAIASAQRGADPRPSLIQDAPGTRFDAVRIGQGDLVFEWTWSYLIAIRGRFTYGDVGPPRSSATVHGTVMTLVVDARTGRITDSGVSDRYPPLRQLGNVRTDLRR